LQYPREISIGGRDRPPSGILFSYTGRDIDVGTGGAVSVARDSLDLSTPLHKNYALMEYEPSSLVVLRGLVVRSKFTQNFLNQYNITTIPIEYCSDDFLYWLSYVLSSVDLRPYAHAIPNIETTYELILRILYSPSVMHLKTPQHIADEFLNAPLRVR
jgi:hypothetical protein